MLALLVSGQRAGAQSASEMETSIQAGASTASRAGAIPLSAFAITPALRFATSRFTLRARGTAWREQDSWQLGDAAASVEARTRTVGGVRAEFTAGADRTFFDRGIQNDQIGAEGRIHYMRDKVGVWLGSGVSRPLRVAAASNVNVSSGGLWTRLGDATLRGSVTSFYFTKVTTDTVQQLEPDQPSACASASEAGPIPAEGTALIMELPLTTSCRQSSSRLYDLEGSVHWQHRLLELSLRAGHRFGPRIDVSPETSRWASMQAAVWITSQIAAVAGGGREPSQPARGLPARNFASLGLMLAYWPIPRQTVLVATPASLVRAFDLRPAGDHLQRLTARIGGVETVEIMGDFTDWAPVHLVRRGRDHWELLLPMSAGVHQINMRIDGGDWIAPPGVPAIKDGFDGEVGVLVIKP